MADINMSNGIKGNKIKIDDRIITLQNSYKLNTDENGNKYYEIETNNKIKFKINEEYLLKIISVKIEDVNYYSKWFNKDNKIYANVNNCNINIVKYLFNKINDTKFRYNIINDNEYDYRLENIKINISNKKNRENTFIKMIKPPVFYKPNEIRIIQEFEGNKINSGSCSGKFNNNYRLVEIINETDESKKRYYEMFVNIYNEENLETNPTTNPSTNTKFSFIFDEASLPKILKLTIDNTIINNPSWLMSTNQYIWHRSSNEIIIYLHRYLMNCIIGDNKTIDHINNNKLDNRLSNLRISTMSQQNMNRPNVSRKHDLNSILNPTNDTSIPNIQTKSLLFINQKKSDGLEYFSIEISKARTKDEEIKDNSSKSRLLTLNEKLCHAIYKRYEHISKYPIIMKEQIDGKLFKTIDEFKLHSESNINEVIRRISETDPILYTLDSFLDYLNTKNIPKYIDPRIKSRLDNRVNTNIQSNYTEAEASLSFVNQNINQTNANTYTYKSDDKFTFIDNGKASRDLSIKITKNVKDNIRVSGSTSKKLIHEERLCYSILNRYFEFIKHENTINIEIHKENITNVNNITINKNTSGKKTLTDLEIEGNKFINFEDFKNHTIKIIKDIMIIIPEFSLPDNSFTIETLNTYFIDKIKNKKCNKPIPILNTKFPILMT